MKRGIVARVQLETYIHATEDVDKVVQALKNVMPLAYRKKLVPVYRRLRGRFGNPITVASLDIKEPELTEGFIREVAERLSQEDKEELLRNLQSHIGEGGSFYLRFDKQEAYLGRLRLEPSEAICAHVRFNLKPYDVREVVDRVKAFCSEVGLIQ